MITILEMTRELQQEGLVGISSHGKEIHVNRETLFPHIPGEIIKTSRNNRDYPFEYSKTYNGVKFFYVGH